jgi:hypothetical protein
VRGGHRSWWSWWWVVVGASPRADCRSWVPGLSRCLRWKGNDDGGGRTICEGRALWVSSVVGVGTSDDGHMPGNGRTSSGGNGCAS